MPASHHNQGKGLEVQEQRGQLWEPADLIPQGRAPGTLSTMPASTDSSSWTKMLVNDKGSGGKACKKTAYYSKKKKKNHIKKNLK